MRKYGREESAKEQLARRTLFPSHERGWQEGDGDKRARKEEVGEKGEERKCLRM